MSDEEDQSLEKTYDYEQYALRKHDFIIRTRSCNFLVHREYLSKEYSYFSLLFSLNLKDQVEGSIVLENAEEGAVKSLMDYCYTSELKRSDCLTLDTFRSAGKCLLKNAKNLLVEYFIKNIDIHNYHELLGVSIRDQIEPLQRAVTRFCLKNFAAVVKSESFLSFEEDTLIRLLKDDNLTARNEIITFNSAMKWISYDEKNRRDKLIDLLQHVRFSQMTLEDLKRLKRSCSDSRVRTMLRNAQEFKSTTVLRRLPHLNKFLDRQFKKRTMYYEKDYLFVVGGVNNDRQQACNILSRYDLELRQWDELAAASQAREYPQAVIVDNDLFVIGGRCNDQVLKSLERYNILSGIWYKDVPDMHVHRCDFAAIYLNENIFCLGGGGSDGQILDSVERYCLRSRRWIKCASMISPRGGFDVCIWRDKIIASGGTNDKYNITNTIESYDPVEDKWSLFTTMPDSRVDFSCCSLSDGRIYFAGGRIQDQQYDDFFIHCYDIISNEWTKPNSYSQPKQVKIINYNDQFLYFLGSEVGPMPVEESLSGIVILDLKTNSKTYIEWASDFREGFGAALYKANNKTNL